MNRVFDIYFNDNTMAVRVEVSEKADKDTIQRRIKKQIDKLNENPDENLHVSELNVFELMPKLECPMCGGPVYKTNNPWYLSQCVVCGEDIWKLDTPEEKRNLY